jgi:hypothetical protein
LAGLAAVPWRCRRGDGWPPSTFFERPLGPSSGTSQVVLPCASAALAPGSWAGTLGEGNRGARDQAGAGEEETGLNGPKSCAPDSSTRGPGDDIRQGALPLQVREGGRGPSGYPCIDSGRLWKPFSKQTHTLRRGPEGPGGQRD